MTDQEKLEEIARLMTELQASIWKGIIYTGTNVNGPRVVLTECSPSKWEAVVK